MNNDLRFNLLHIGDLFVGAVQKTADSALELSKDVGKSRNPKAFYSSRRNKSGKIVKRVSGLLKRERFFGVVRKTADSAVKFSKFVIRRYDLTLLKSQKKKISGEIIERVSGIIKTGNSFLSHDAVLAGLVTRLNGVEKNLSGYRKQSSRPVGPVTAIITRLGTALFRAINK